MESCCAGRLSGGRPLDQHGAGGGADDAHADLAGEADGGGAAGDLQMEEAGGLREGHVDGAVQEGRHAEVLQHPAFGEEAVGEGGVGRRALGTHARPVCVQLLGGQHGERGVDALTHVDVGDVDGDGVVRADLDPAAEKAFAVAGDEDSSPGVEGVDPGAVAEGQAARGGHRADEEGPALHRQCSSSPSRLVGQSADGAADAG